MEWLYHIGVPEGEIEELATNSANTVPVMMPYIDAFFMPRAYGDRPKVVPDGSVNFAFLGQFAETPRDTIFTTEYSMRTGMEAGAACMCARLDATSTAAWNGTDIEKRFSPVGARNLKRQEPGNLGKHL